MSRHVKCERCRIDFSAEAAKGLELRCPACHGRLVDVKEEGKEVKRAPSDQLD